MTTNVSYKLGGILPEDLESTIECLYNLAASFGHKSDTQAYLNWLRDLRDACLIDEQEGSRHPLHDIVVEEEARATHVLDPDCPCRECGGGFVSDQELQEQNRAARREDERLASLDFF